MLALLRAASTDAPFCVQHSPLFTAFCVPAVQCGLWLVCTCASAQSAAMKLHSTPNARSMATLQPGQPVHTMAIARGQTVELKTTAGCTWITRDGALQDWLLPAGGQWNVQGPACLRLGSADLHRPAKVEWKTSQPQPLCQRLAVAWHRLPVWRRPVALSAPT